MKINRTYSLDANVCEQLEKEKNASKLINDLLKDYFITGNLKEEELLKKSKEIELEILEKEAEHNKIHEQILKIKKKQKHLKDTFKSIPDEILQDFRDFPKMTKDALKNRYSDIYKRKYKVTLEEIEKAFEEYIK
tara:strand:+ start:93 stop:497 length:405 start_codon:yes stop_codon:yes gene_type:complete